MVLLIFIILAGLAISEEIEKRKKGRRRSERKEAPPLGSRAKLLEDQPRGEGAEEAQAVEVELLQLEPAKKKEFKRSSTTQEWEFIEYKNI